MAEEDLPLAEGDQDSDLRKAYSELIDKDQEQVPLRRALDIAPTIAPQKAGDVIRLSRKTGLYPDTVNNAFDKVKRTADQPTDEQIDSIHDETPRFAKWLGDKYNAAAVQNDIPKLQKLEKSLKTEDPLLRVRPDEEVVRRATADATARFNDLVAEEGKSFISPVEGDYITSMKRTPEQREKLKETLIKEEIDRQREQEKFIASNEKLGVADQFGGMSDTGPGGFNPFKGVPVLSTIPQIINAEERAMREARMSPEDINILLQEKRLEAAAARRGSTKMAKVANVAANLSEFIGELGVTGGTSLAPSIGKGLLGWLGTKGLEIGAKTALTQGPRIALNTIKGGTPDTYVAQDDNGELQINTVDAKGQTYAVPFMKAVKDSLLDVASAEIPIHPAFKFWNKTAKINPTAESFMKAFAKGGAESVVGGIAISDATTLAKELLNFDGHVSMPMSIKAIMGDKEAQQEILATGGVFGIMGAAGSVVQRRRAAAEIIHGQAISYKDWIRDASGNIKEMDAFKSHPEVVADSIKGMVDGTDKAFTYVPANVFADHYTKLGIDPDKFAEEMTGNPKALEDARITNKLQLPTDQYLTKIGATDAGPVFEAAGATFNAAIPPVETIEGRIKELDAELRAGKEAKITPEDAKFKEAVDSLGKSFKDRAQEHGVDLSKFVEQPDVNASEQKTRESVNRIASESKEMLLNAGVKEDEASALSQILSAGFKSLGERENIDPYALFTERPLTVTREGGQNIDPSGKVYEQPAYHASPHKFRKFSLRKIGSGEGNQAQGWGLYFASQREVGQYYRERLGGDNGRLYSVEIPDDGSYLHWDKEIHDQPENVKAALSKLLPVEYSNYEKLRSEGKALPEYMKKGRYFYNLLSEKLTPKDRYTLNPELASKALAKEGVPGIQYFDQGSRANSKGTSNYVLFDDKLVNIKSYEQPGEGGARGRINIGDTSINIDLLKTANASTFLHETGHLYLDLIERLASRPDASKKLKADYQTVRDWMGLEDGDAIKAEHHEKWAESFEEYLKEGKAPSVALRGAFSRFKQWLSDIYGSIKGALGKDLNDDIREVMDRLLATDKEIKQAKKQVDTQSVINAKKAVTALAASTESVESARADLGQAKPLLQDVQNLVMKPDEAMEYAKLVKESQNAAYNQLDEKALGDLNKDRKQHYDMIEGQVRDGLKKEVERLPEYQARTIMETGLDAEGNVVQEGGIKLSRESLKETHNETTIDQLPRKVIATAKEAGYTADQAAELLGFSSGDELIQKLSGMEPLESVIDRRTAEIMDKMRLSELAELPEAAKEAIHNDQEAKVKAFQLKWLLENHLPEMKDLLRKVSNPKQYVKDVRIAAEKHIAGLSSKQNTPSMYEGAEAEANRNAREALLSGDLKNAAKFMEMELLNHELYRASQEGRQDARRIREYANEFNGSDKRKLMYAGGEQYLAQTDAFLEKYSFRNQSGKKLEALKSLKEFVESEADAGYISQIPEKLLKESAKQNWQDVPIQDLRGIETLLKTLRKNAELKTSFLEGRELKDLNQRATDIVAQVKSSKEALPKPLDSFTAEEEAKRTRNSLALSPRNDAALYREMDGFKDGGIMQQTFSRRLNESATKEAQLNERAMYALDDIYGKFSPLERIKMHRSKYIKEINGSLSAWQRMEIAALIGQEGARQRFLDGRGWGDVQLKAITEGLTEKQWAWVADVHKFLKSYEPDIKEQIERRTGLPAKMVKAEPIETPFGKQEGGYFPFKYDPRYDPQTGKMIELDEAKMAMQAVGMQAQTKAGSLETRAEAVKGRRLRFDVGVLFDHVREINHAIAFSETLRDLSRLLTHKDVSKAITDHYGDQVYKQLSTSLHDIAVGDRPAQHAYERFLNWIRRGSTTAALSANFMQAVTDMAGLTQGAVRIGPKWMGEGAKKVLGDAVRMENAAKEMFDNSEMMRLRSKTFFREINEVRNQVEKKGVLAQIADLGIDAVTAGKLDVQDVHNGFYYMMTKVQLAQELPLWWGAMEKAKTEKPLAPDASPAVAEATRKAWISMADQAVLDTYGGGQIKDLAPIQKGGAAQKVLFSTFYSFANRTLNLAIESGYKNMRKPTIASVGRFAADMALLYTLPALVTFAIKNALTQNDKDLPGRLVKDQVSYMLSSLPLVREVTPALQDRDYSGPAGMRLIPTVVSAAKNAMHGKADWKDLNQAGGILFHYPALQLERLVRGIESMVNGKGTPLAPFFGPPPKRR